MQEVTCNLPIAMAVLFSEKQADESRDAEYGQI